MTDNCCESCHEAVGQCWACYKIRDRENLDAIKVAHLKAERENG